MGNADLGAHAGVSAPATGLGHIFISYARADARRANQIERVLAAWGCSTWMDRQQLSGGQNWTAELERAIKESAALALILTPAALQSPMVRREYQQALRDAIPVVLVQYRPVNNVPPELAHAPCIDMRNHLHAGPQLYFALADCGVIPPAPTGELDARTAAATAPAFFAVTEGRIPASWRVYRAPWRLYVWRILGRCAPLLLCLWALNLSSSWWAALMRQGWSWWAVNIIGPCLIPFAFFFVLPAISYAFVLMRRAEREMIVLTPEWCFTVFIQRERLNSVAFLHRYEYRWATEAHVTRDRWGAVRVLFMSGNGGPQASLRFSWIWRNRAVIARQIVADAQAFQRQRAAEREPLAAPAPLPAEAAHTLAVPGTPSSVQSWYAVIAPRSAGALIASVQAWLNMRGLFPVEMLWTPDAGGVLAPTARGAAQCRFVLFVDAPSITRSPRWRAVLHDLQRQGKPLIPLRVQARQPAPSEWTSLQWVDFSPAVSRARSFLSLCDTLDRAGLLPMSWLPSSPPSIDTELALARATYQRLPPGWRAFYPEPVIRQAQRRTRTTFWLVTAFLLASAVFVAVYQIVVADSRMFGTIDVFASLVAVLAAVALQKSLPLGRRLLSAVRKTSTQGDPLSDFSIPECVLLAPEGIVFHLHDSRVREAGRCRTRVLSLADATLKKPLRGSVTFAEARAIEGRIGLTGARTLRIQLHDGGTIELPLAAFLATAEMVIDHALAAFNAYRAGRLNAEGGPSLVAEQ